MLLQNQQKKEMHLEAQVKEQNNEMTSSMGFNKAESANFIFDCVQYLMPKEGKSNFPSCANCSVLRALCCGSREHIKDRGEHSDPQQP